MDDDPDLDNALISITLPKRSVTSKEFSATGTSVVRNPPEDFNFPFQPYSIQTEFMRQLFLCIENGKIGIFESPTGTGKSLSLICGSLAWLQSFQRNFLEEANRVIRLAEELRIEYEKSNNWLDNYEPMKIQDELAFQYKKQLDCLKAVDERLKNSRLKNDIPKAYKANLKRQAIDEDIEHQTGEAVESSEQEFALEDYFSGDELDNIDSSENKGEEDDQFYATKIFYTSRTHSQIGQFLSELKRTKYANSTRAVILGSRQNMCINDEVRKLGSINLMNDKCLQLQSKKSSVKIPKTSDDDNVGKHKRSKKCDSCPYFRPEANKRLADEYLSRVQDIEQMVDAARKVKCCPYYASRYAVANADLVMAPYQIVLSPSARAACNIKYVLADEAHNLLDTINAVNSCRIDVKCVQSALVQLSSYLVRYRSRLNPSNLLYLRHLTSILNSLSKFFDRFRCNVDKQISSIYKLTDFLFQLNIADINFYKLTNYMHKSKISRKLSGYARMLSANKESKTTVAVETVDEEIKKSFCSLAQIEAFVNAVRNARDDSRILIEIPSSDQDASTLSLKFLNLDPSTNVGELFLEPRSVILAGGTMQPTSDLTEQLFRPLKIDNDKIRLFSFDHVIPPANVLPIALSCGPSNKRLEFTFETRKNPQVIDDLGRLIINLCNIVPGGIVCFFPSYDYERLIFEKFKANGSLSRIGIKKKFFREPKESNQLASLLEDYSLCIKLAKNHSSSSANKSNTVTGAVLFAVVGGKLSEGINFSDDLGRCVVMVGMPYAFKDNPELLERMKFIDNIHVKNGNKPELVANNNNSSRNYYDNLCWKSINQTIGRSIRHAKDYAAILLVDSRYVDRLNSTKKFLPHWIGKNLKTVTSFGTCLCDMKRFFDCHARSS